MIKKVLSILCVLALMLSLAPAALAEAPSGGSSGSAANEEADPNLEVIAAPAIAGPTEYLEPVFYENEDGPTIGVVYTGVIKTDGLYFKDSNNNKNWSHMKTGGCPWRSASSI